MDLEHDIPGFTSLKMAVTTITDTQNIYFRVLLAVVVLTLGLATTANGDSGPVCYNCALQQGSDCRTGIRLCNSDEVCVISTVKAPDGRDLFLSSQCMEATTCHKISASLIGRRRTIYNGQHCFRCCDQDLCNANCTGPATSMATTTNPAPTQPTIRGSTMAPCKDSLSQETCLQVQQFVCRNITMATNAGCLHTCKFC